MRQQKKKRAPDWEERTQQSNWEQGRPTHNGETSLSKTQSDAHGDHEEQAPQQPPNAADAEQAISNQAPPSPHGCPQTPQGRGLCPTRQVVPATGVGNRAVTSPLRTRDSQRRAET